MMSLKYIIILVIAFLINSLHAQGSNTVCRIKYISAENVYLDNGSTAGITIGDVFEVKRNNTSIAMIEVIFVAQNSASCKVLDQKFALQVGDFAYLLKTKQVKEKPVEKTPRREREIPKRVTSKRQQPFARISGGVSLQWYHIKDLTAANLNFNQPAARLTLKARNMWGKDYTFQLRVRTRYNHRSRPYSSNVPSEEWRNRIYMFSFSYDNEQSLINYKVGRIISNKFSGVGYIDGLVLQHNISPTVNWGLFAGTQPQWQYSYFQTSLQKYGGYFNYARGNHLTNRIETTLAFAGEYHGPTISREFLYLQSSVGVRSRWSIYQSLELDYNRDWRKEKSGKSISLTSAYVYTRYKLSDWLTVGMSYDNRQNYYTYETRSLAESLFDDAFRQGLRGDLHITLPNKYRLYTNFGMRKRKGDAESNYSFRSGISKMDFLIRRLSIHMYASGFSNFFNKGFNPSVRLNKMFTGGHNVSLAYGLYSYRLKVGNNHRMNQWFRILSLIDLFSKLYFSGSYEYTWGDDSLGHRILTEIGYRF